jgi:hypothetical protein
VSPRLLAQQLYGIVVLVVAGRQAHGEFAQLDTERTALEDDRMYLVALSSGKALKDDPEADQHDDAYRQAE